MFAKTNHIFYSVTKEGAKLESLTIDIYKEIDLYESFSVYYRERLIKWIRWQLQKGQSVKFWQFGGGFAASACVFNKVIKGD